MRSPRITEIVGRFTRASNATLLARAGPELVVYKPTAGERPLWDFPVDTLAAREVLSYEVDRALGFGLVPETVLGDGPLGPGSIQRFVTVDESFDPVPLIRAADPRLWPVALLDLVTNNADRKAGHVLAEEGTRRLFAIDHGLTFHPEDKLRTVLWGFAGQPLPAELLEPLDRLAEAVDGALGGRVASLLGPAELAALRERVRTLRSVPVHPLPPDDRHAVPWPPV